MFKRREVFTESFLPRELPGRTSQLDDLARLISPTTTGQPARSCWELGPSGVGKTTTARWILEDLRDNHAITWTRVECVGSTRWDLLGEICGAHPRVPHHPGMGVAEMAQKLAANLTRPYVVILDEFDGLEDEELLFDLAEAEMVSLICIAHDEESALSTVPKSLEGLRGAEIIEFDGYDADSLFEILKARVEIGMDSGAVSDPQLHRIVQGAGGSARRAVQSLRSAIELAQERGHREVLEEDVDDCFEHAMARIREQLLASLSREHHIVYQVIRDAGPKGIRSNAILDRYQRLSTNPRSRQQVGNYRAKLERYGLVESDGDGRWATYTVVDEALDAPVKRTV